MLGPPVKANGFSFLLVLLAVIAACSALAILGPPAQAPGAAQARGPAG